MADGIMSLARRLGERVSSPWHKEATLIPELTTITGPQRPTQGRWPPHIWAEMQRIYQTPDPFEDTP